MKKLLLMCGYLTLVCSLISCSSGGGGVSSQTRAVTGLSQCSVLPHRDGYYYIAEAFIFNGSLQTASSLVDDAIWLAVNEINTAGGIKGKKLGVIECDTGGDPTTSANIFTELAGVSPYSVILGPQTTPEFLKSYPIGVAAKKTMMVTTVASSVLSEIPIGPYTSFDGYVFRTVMTNEYMGPVVANIVKGGYTRPYVIFKNDSFGIPLKNQFRKAYDPNYDSNNPGNGEIGYDPNAINASAVIAAAKAYNPDIIYLVSLATDGDTILKEAIADSWNPTWFLTYGPKTPSICTDIGNYSYLNNTLGIDCAAPGPNYQAFSDAYQALWNVDPIDVPFLQNIYDGVYLAAMAMELADDPDDGTQVRDILAAGNTQTGTQVNPGIDGWKNFLKVKSEGSVNYVGASGPVDFGSHNNEVYSNMLEWQIKTGSDGVSCVIEQAQCWTYDTQQAISCN